MKIVCIPGLGVDGRVFTPQKAYFGEKICCPAYIKPDAQEELRAYCQRWAKVIQQTLHEPYVLLGMSLGGMCAQELSQYLSPKAVILLGSLRKPMQHVFGHRVLEKIGQMLPAVMLQAFRWYAPYITAKIEGLNVEDTQLLLRMSRDMDIHFYKWQAHAGARWIQQGFLGEDTCPVFRAHGGKDEILFLETGLGEDDLYLPKAHHLINLTDAPAINAFIEKCIEKVQSDDNME